MTSLTGKIFRLLFHYDWEIIEMQSAAFKFIWGVVLLAPHNTFSGSKFYAFYAGVAPEWVWGLALVIVAAGHFSTLFTGNVAWRKSFLMLGIIYWLSNIIALWIAAPFNLSGALVLVMVGFLVINYLRLAAIIRPLKNG